MENINIGVASLIVSNKLKETYFQNDDTLLNESKKNISDFFRIIKESKILQLEFNVINNIDKKYIENDVIATKYIDDNVKLFEYYDIDEINAEHLKLKKFIIDKIDNLPQDKIKLYESIYTLITEPLKENNLINVDNIHESFTYVLNHLKTKKSKSFNDDKLDNSQYNEDVINLAVRNFNNKYTSLMNEDDRKIFLSLINSNKTEKKKIFENYKTENLAKLKSLTENKVDIKENLLKAIDKIENTHYNTNTVNDDIISLYELRKKLN